MAWRGGQELVFVLWLFGVPALAGGLAFDAVPFVSAAAWCLLAATLLDTVNLIRILRHAFLTPGESSSTASTETLRPHEAVGKEVITSKRGQERG